MAEKVQHTPLDSSFLTSAGHDGENRAEVVMANGKRYEIQGIPADAYQAWMDAESQGQHFNKTIKATYPVVAMEE